MDLLVQPWRTVDQALVVVASWHVKIVVLKGHSVSKQVTAPAVSAEDEANAQDLAEEQRGCQTMAQKTEAQVSCAEAMTDAPAARSRCQPPLSEFLPHLPRATLLRFCPPLLSLRYLHSIGSRPPVTGPESGVTEEIPSRGSRRTGNASQCST